MMKLKLLLAAVTACALFGSVPAKAGGMWQNWPGIGYASYCSAIVGSSNVQAGQTGQGTGGSAGVGTNGVYCAQTVPAGPSVFAGTEYLPLDLGPLGVVSGSPLSSAVVQLSQLGQGPMVDLTTVATAQTIPNNTPWYFLDGAQGSALTVTMPAVAIEGQIQHVVCEASTVGVLTVAANTNQTLKGNPNAACTAVTGYAWRYQASNSTWYRY